ncbi:MAG: galactonate dehydratase [Bacteroidetes bacterium]|nr:galactonate dehydratase [Bacteroidota bacterium]MCL5026360.1 galactonate dehydratase [Chloroflexota bacterium]
MKVTEVKTYLVMKNQRRHYAIVQIVTDEGISGIGECTVSDWGLAVGGAIQRMAEKFVVGEDPRQIEKLWDDMYRASFWGRGGGPILTAAISGIEEACWDILGKRLGVPVYALLGGKCRDKLRVYANGWYGEARQQRNLALYGKLAEKVVKDGYTALKFDPFIEQLEMGRGIPDKILDRDHIKRIVDRVRVVREAVGPDVDIIIEVHGWLSATSAIQVAKLLEPFRPFAYEEPVDPTNVDAMRRVREEVSFPIATGERVYSHWGFRELIEKQAADILQPDINITGGILETKKIAAMADAYHIPVAPHNCWGPVASAAALQVDACTKNFIIQEWFTYNEPWHYEMVTDALEHHTKDGYIDVPTAPGLGVDLNEKMVAPFLHSSVKAE